jgi:DNA modification methylase
MEKYLNKITLGDSYKLIKELPDKSVNCVYTDVPYLMPNNKGGAGFMGERVGRIINEELKNFRAGIDFSILDQFIRVLKTLNIFIWCNKFMINDLLSYFINKGCKKYEIMVWAKNNPIPMTNNVWLSDLEYCLWFGEKETELNDGYELKSKWYQSPINKADKDLFNHPTIKPLELVKRHLLHATQPKDIVLDCFMGSGTTAVACQETGRQFIGFEIEPKWVKVANDRLNKTDANGQQSLFLR